MSAKRYTDEFKIEAVKQVINRNYKISDVAKRLGVTTKSIHNWITVYGKSSAQNQTMGSQQSELRKLKTELRRVKVHRRWLKTPLSKRAIEDKRLLEKIKPFWIESGFSYGYRNITRDMKSFGYSCGITEFTES